MRLIAVLVLVFSSLVAASQQTPAAAPVAPAAQPASDADIERLVEAMHIRKNMAEMQRTMLDQYKPMIEKMSADALQTMTPQERKKYNDIINDMMSEAVQSYPADEMIRDIGPVYKKYLDKADIEAMIRFYSSPSGQKFLDSQPNIIRDFMSVMVPKMQERMQGPINKMQARIRQMVAEEQGQPAQEKGFKPAAPATPQN